MPDNNTVTRTGDDAAYIGRCSEYNPSYNLVEIGKYFVYDKYNHLSNWIGYQVGLKVSYQYMIPVHLPFTKLKEAISYCKLCESMRDI